MEPLLPINMDIFQCSISPPYGYEAPLAYTNSCQYSVFLATGTKALSAYMSSFKGLIFYVSHAISI